MNRQTRMVLVGLVMAVLAACGNSTSPSGSPAASSEPPAASATQRSEGGQVTVVATWTGPTAEAKIDVALDTHSVDLDALDLADATLRNDRGDTLTARPWAAPKGGHHREGTLTFDGLQDATLPGQHRDERHRDRRHRSPAPARPPGLCRHRAGESARADVSG